MTVTSVAAIAQDRHDHRGPGQPGPSAHYRSPHWVYDDRYHHDHYYPAAGYSIRTLPPGHIAVPFRGARYFYSAGVWFAPGSGGYVVIRPPLGVVVPVLPPAYAIVRVGPVAYYYANDVYYAPAAGSPGYVVVASPAPTAVTSYEEAAASPPPAPQPAPVPAAPTQPSAATWYYCDSAKAYYPYVSECQEGWRPVPATPPAPSTSR